MKYDGGRRTFLKTAVGATGMLARAAQETQPRAAKPRRAADVRISSTPYTPAEYPIRPQVYHRVALRDTFWRPKVETNARVTIPFELRKFAELDRALSGGVLEAGICRCVRIRIHTCRARLKLRHPGSGQRQLLDVHTADGRHGGSYRLRQ